MQHQLVIGNATTEYTYGRSLDSFPTKTLNTRHAESARTAWLLRDGDAMVTERPLTDGFAAYLGRTLGLDLDSITFLTHDKEASGSQFLDGASLLEPGLVKQLSDVVGPDWKVVPYIHDRTIATLGRRLGLDDRANPPFFAQGGSDIFNSKAFFRAWTSGLGAPVAAGQVTRNRAATAQAVAELLPVTGSVIVKQDFSASGYGNVLFTTDGDTPGIGVSGTHVVDDGVGVDELFALLSESFPAVDQVRDFPDGLRPCEAVVEVYYANSLTFYSEVDIPEPDAEPTVLNWGLMRMEPTWNGFVIPSPDLSGTAEAEMLSWSVEMAAYLQRTGYRGLLNCDSILTPDGRMLFSEVNARVGGCTHVHHAAARLLGDDYLRHYTLRTRNNLPCADFTALAKIIDDDDLLGSGPAGGCGALLLVDDTTYNHVVQYLAYGDTPQKARAAEERLVALATG
ncbi:hypothetical protein [Streptomyces sp. H39-S7]|uniref:preATP grasp domain-containing protein n=1 Tax=Streptomyces sp. H39-S7 TaxID=3004357 RepID=UPI0022B02F35|nr:hypothetical protein [Streptomyces sp. H39-S7]MCZ4119898.1 hypothetical protein [Streptomyces sp. H39-S7]